MHSALEHSHARAIVVPLLAAMAMLVCGLMLPEVARAADVTPPAGGSVTVPDIVTTALSTNIPVAPGTDLESGIASWQVYVASATFSGGSCGNYGGWSPVGGASPAGALTVSPANGSCTIYQLRVLDNAGNLATFSSPSVLRIDRMAPYGIIDDPGPATVAGQLHLAGTAIDVHSGINRVVITYSGPSSGVACDDTSIIDGHWACTWTTGGIPAGQYTLSITVYDDAGLSFSGVLDAKVDATELLRGIVHDVIASGPDSRPPSVGFEPLDPVAWSTKARLRFWGVDWPDVSPTFRVQRRYAKASGGRFTGRSIDKRDPLAAIVGNRGVTSCYRILAADILGNSAISQEQCATVPYDDRNLTRISGDWRERRPPGSWLRTTLSATKRWSELKLPYGTTNMSVLATVCPTCGTFQVLQGKKLLTTINTKGKRLDRQFVFPIAGTVAGKPLRIRLMKGFVEIDGVVAARTPPA